MSLTHLRTGTFRSFDGTRIYYEVRGDGPPVFLAYGIGCVINHWRHQIRHFSQSHSVVVFDYRAHHKSEIPELRGNLTLDALAQDIAELARHLEFPAFSLWGHSFGTQVAIRTFDMYPHLVKNLVFINGFVSNPLEGMFGTEVPTHIFRLIREGYNSLPQTISYLWRFATNNPLAIQLSALAGGFNLQLTSLKDIEIYARGVGAIDLNSFLTLFEAMTLFDGRPVLNRINIPTLIIAGKSDSVTPPHHQEELHQKVSTSELLMVPYGSHCTQLDMPDLVNLKIEQFLKKHYW